MIEKFGIGKFKRESKNRRKNEIWGEEIFEMRRGNEEEGERKGKIMK